MSYSKTVTLPVSPDEAFALVTEPERLRRWKTVSAYVDLRAGGAYRWTINPGHTVAGTFREVEPGRRIVYGWGWEGSDELPPDASTVTVTIEPDPAGSRVTLSHEGLPPEQEGMHAEGWNHYLGRLERLPPPRGRRPRRVGLGTRGPHADHRGRGGSCRSPAGAARPLGRRPVGADALRGL